MTDSVGFSHVVALKVGDGLARFQKVSVGVVTSPHTGRNLEVVSAESVLPAAVASALADAVSGGGRLSSEDGRVWQVSPRRESYGDPDGPHEVALELTEVEEVSASEVRLAGLTLVPETYEEQVDEDSGALIVTLRTTLVSPQLEQWRELVEARLNAEEPYYDVVRVGVEDRPVRMRLGRTFWSAAGDGVEALINLVEERFDTADRGRSLFAHVNEPDLTHALRWAKRSEVGIDALVEELVAAGVLTPEAVARVESKRAAARRTLSWAGSEVEDLDDFA